MGKAFNLEIIRELENMTDEDAREAAIKMIDESNMKNASKGKLSLSIQKTQTAKKVSEIMWYSYLAGEGLASPDSRWNPRWKNK